MTISLRGAVNVGDDATEYGEHVWKALKTRGRKRVSRGSLRTSWRTHRFTDRVHIVPAFVLW